MKAVQESHEGRMWPQGSTSPTCGIKNKYKYKNSIKNNHKPLKYCGGHSFPRVYVFVCFKILFNM